jgi:hypothetical protein
VNQIKSVAESAVRNAQETGQSLINNQKENLANRFSEYAKAIETDYVREKQPAELLDDLESLASRKPELVFGGLFVVGFAAARFFKASRRQSPRERSTAEGVVGKRVGSVYECGERSGAWIKGRINRAQEFVIGGFVPGSHGIDSLIVGVYEKKGVTFVAKVRNGFLPRIREEIFPQLKKRIIETAHSPISPRRRPRAGARLSPPKR